MNNNKQQFFAVGKRKSKNLQFLKIKQLQAFCVGDPPETRTPDTLLKRQVLYRLS